MKKGILLILCIILVNTYLSAQVVTAVAPLKPGNKWVYHSEVVFQGKIKKFEVTDSVKVIKGISFYNVLGGGFMALANDEFFVRYSETMADSLYKYFKVSPNKGDLWEQAWASDSTILYNTIVDTFTANVFGYSTLVYQLDRTTVMDGDTTFFGGSREYWTEEFGMLNGIYEQAEDILLGCVIDGVVYGDTTTVGIDDEDKIIPTEFELYQNYPNPFNPNTIISWQIAVSSYVQLKVYDLLGSEIKTLVNEYKLPGKYEITFNADGLPSGIYFYRIITSNSSITKKMMYLK